MLEDAIEKLTGISVNALRAIPLCEINDLASRMRDKPLWRQREMVAEVVNRQPPEHGNWRWKCEGCGYEWLEPVNEDPTYDRTKDYSNWPVLCGGSKCENKTSIAA